MQIKVDFLSSFLHTYTQKGKAGEQKLHIRKMKDKKGSF